MSFKILMYLKILNLKFIDNSWENSYTKFVLRDTQILQSYYFFTEPSTLQGNSEISTLNSLTKSFPLMYFNAIQFKVVK